MSTHIITLTKNKLLQGQIILFLNRRTKSKQVIIPQRIERGPTDILKALSATIKRDPVACEYRFPESGLFLVRSSAQKQSIALSQESGRKAAKWVVENNPHLFDHKVSDPFIKAFAPPDVITPESNVTLEDLISAIYEAQVSKAIQIYEILKERSIDMPQSAKQLLLELVCFYNSADKPDETLAELKYFGSLEKNNVATWKSEGFAVKLFSEMEADSQSYSSLIQGMLKYGDVQNGLHLCENAKEKGIKLSVEVYNQILAKVGSYKALYRDREIEIKSILNTMNEENLAPNIGTLNAALSSVAEMRTWMVSRDLALKLYNEFTSIGVEPSLGTYSYILRVFFNRSKTDEIFQEVLDKVKNKSWDLKHEEDLNFFGRAMEICNVNYSSVSLAEKVNNIVQFGKNSDFLNTSLALNHYYRNFFMVLFENDTELGMKYFTELVPGICIPEVIVYLNILKSIKNDCETKYLQQVWSEIKFSGMGRLTKILELVLEILKYAQKNREEELALKIANDIWQDIQTLERNSLSWNSDIISNLLTIFACAKDEKTAADIFNEIRKLENIELSAEASEMFLNLCVSAKNKETSLALLQDCSTKNHPNINKLAEVVRSSFELLPEEVTLVSQYFTKEKNKSESTESES